MLPKDKSTAFVVCTGFLQPLHGEFSLFAFENTRTVPGAVRRTGSNICDGT